MSDSLKYQIQFTIDRDNNHFCDALYFTPEEYNALKPDDIEALKEERYSNWVKVISTPPPEPDPIQVLADTEAQIEALQGQIDSLTLQMPELQAKADSMKPIDVKPLPVEVIGGK